MPTLQSIFVIPGYTFFYWGFTLPKKQYEDYIKHFDLQKGPQIIFLKIGSKRYPAKIRVARIRTANFPNRDVVQIYYDTQRNTLKALRKEFVYSYATTINKSKPKLKELMELEHLGDNNFRVKPIGRQETDFDSMFKEMEDRHLFEYWKDMKSNKEDNFFIEAADSWISVNDLKKYENRPNVIYILYNSKKNQIYVGKANILGNRVKKGLGRNGLDGDWDKFMYYVIDPKYSPFIEQIEAFTIRTYAAILQNKVRIKNIEDKKLQLCNLQLINRS